MNPRFEIEDNEIYYIAEDEIDGSRTKTLLATIYEIDQYFVIFHEECLKPVKIFTNYDDILPWAPSFSW